jgi:hypothetical protein
METQVTYDIGEEILFRLKELNLILDKILEKKNEKECTNPPCSNESSTRTAEDDSKRTRDKFE